MRARKPVDAEQFAAWRLGALIGFVVFTAVLIAGVVVPLRVLEQPGVKRQLEIRNILEQPTEKE